VNRMVQPLAALGIVALLGAGCSKDDTDAETADTADTTADTSTSTTLDRREQGVRFAECIRAHDVSDFPDPDATGDFVYAVSVSPEVWAAAVDACKDLQPPGTLSGDRTPVQQSAALRFAQCIRDNGVPDFPDPVDGEPLVDTNRIPSANQPGGMDILNAAMETCGSIIEDAAAGQ
jgi:hypothetical protein